MKYLTRKIFCFTKIKSFAFNICFTKTPKVNNSMQYCEPVSLADTKVNYISFLTFVNINNTAHENLVLMLNRVGKNSFLSKVDITSLASAEI